MPSFRTESEPFAQKGTHVLYVGGSVVEELAVEVGQEAREIFVQAHVDGGGVLALEPVALGNPAVFSPSEFQLRHPASYVEQVVFLPEGEDRPRFGFMAVTDSHS